MSRIRIALLTAVALAATLPSIGSAQEPRGRGDGAEHAGRGPRPEGGGQRQGQPQQQPQSQPRPAPVAPPQAQVQAQPQPGFRGQPGGQGQPGQARPRGDDRSRFAGGPPPMRGYEPGRDAGARFAPDGRRPDPRGYDARNDQRGDQRGYASRGYDARAAGQGRIGADWRADRRYDWRGYRDTHAQQFRVGRYVAPRGWSYGYQPRGWSYGYQRLSIGYRINPYFYAANYWIDDPYDYRLPPVWGTYRWVRYYDDALLIDTATGVVIDEIPDFFW